MPHPTYTNSRDALKIAVLGAGGGIGQSLSLLLKTELHTTCVAADARVHIAMYDVNRDAVAGAATDLSHINTAVYVTWHAPEAGSGPDPLAACLRGAQLVVIPAGVPRKPGMTRDDLFAINASIVKTLSQGIAAHCDLSRTFVLLISNPVNSLVPVLVETLVVAGGHQRVTPQTVARRVFGLTQLDAVRASAFLHEALGLLPGQSVRVPVVGGHSGHTIVPLFSQAVVGTDKLQERVRSLGPDVLSQLVNRVQFGGDEVVKAKNGAGSATLSMAYAAAQVTRGFAELLLGVREELQDTLYVNVGAFAFGEQVTQLTQGLPYVSLPLAISRDGLQAVDTQWAQKLAPEERKLWAVCIQELQTAVPQHQEQQS
ncbi:LAME_0F15192g1_1 [Lachancea meyersii CBS 8951]|uniref:malate dehydrogenase n=1 Tax=Lachancea meyersii CBS 8951 TaxID=1266667 RepID=A0A1G4JYA8_9SACH|nr:LAME_0F15192g1_1 [Lachancea meyersii CBS 8951]